MPAAVSICRICGDSGTVPGPVVSCPNCADDIQVGGATFAPGELLDRVKADAQALADVRTLDGQGSWDMDQDPEGWLTLGEDGINISGKRAPAPDAARAKAAAWVREQKPSGK